MIVCSCNALSDRTIEALITRTGACPRRVSDVFESCACRPQCGRCALSIRRLLDERAAATAVDPDYAIAAE
ncbi:MAG: (2Fe-2S)-binding protein [Hyphomicrobiales bacterium]|nr:(2Fe-2S)-binding protein [Hyphomicrobiales bacterium]